MIPAKITLMKGRGEGRGREREERERGEGTHLISSTTSLA